MKFNRFEELECWQEARVLTKRIYTGAAISIMNNICEGFDSLSNNEFIRFLTYSRRSCSETQNCLYVALDQAYISKDEFQDTYNHCGKVRKIIGGLIRYLKKHRSKSNKQPD
jgi:four helix bundle protein